MLLPVLMVMGVRLDVGAKALLGQPWRDMDKVVIPQESLIWVFACLCAPERLWACADESLMGRWPL